MKSFSDCLCKVWFCEMLATEAVAMGTGFSELVPGNVDTTFVDLCSDLANKFEKGFNEAREKVLLEKKGDKSWKESSWDDMNVDRIARRVALSPILPIHNPYRWSPPQATPNSLPSFSLSGSYSASTGSALCCALSASPPSGRAVPQGSKFSKFPQFPPNQNWP